MVMRLDRERMVALPLPELLLRHLLDRACLPPGERQHRLHHLLHGQLGLCWQENKEILVQASKVSGALGGDRRPAEAGRRCGRSGSGRAEPLMASSETPSLRPRRSSAGRARGQFVLQLLSGPSTSSGTGWIGRCWGSRPADGEMCETFLVVLLF